MLKILHLADLHLDSRFVGLSSIDAAKRRSELRGVFLNALRLAKSEGCAATLICGDLFDGEYYTADTLRFLSESFASMPEHKFFITPGNHDHGGPTSPYRFTRFPENVHVFDSEALTCITLDELKLNVYGYAFTAKGYFSNPLEYFTGAKQNGYFNVLCAHTELDAVMSSYAPITRKSLDGSGFDYAALGHVHNSDEIGKVGNTVYAYSGSLAGRDFTEHGEKGGILLTFDEANGKKNVNAARIRLCPWIYDTVSVPLDGAADLEQGIQKASDAIKKHTDLYAEYIIRLRLTGQITFELNEQVMLSRLAPLGVKEIKNETRIPLVLTELENDYSLRGVFYQTLKPRLTSENEQERKAAELALRYGLAALDLNEIDI